MAVSITHTAANHFGSKVVCQRTGLLLDAAMGWFNALPGAANSIAGGKRPLANMGPLLVTKRGTPVAAVGPPGGRRIISAMVQVVIDLVERGNECRRGRARAADRCERRNAGFGTPRTGGERDPRPARQRQPGLGAARGVGYELARPIVAVRDDRGGISAAADPFSRGCAVAD